VGGAAGLHDHVGLRDQRVNESFELASREALTIDDASGPIGKGHLEHAFGKIDGDGRCVHDISFPDVAVALVGLPEGLPSTLTACGVDVRRWHWRRGSVLSGKCLHGETRGRLIGQAPAVAAPQTSIDW
jgi:hypothetical protein